MGYYFYKFIREKKIEQEKDWNKQIAGVNIFI